MAEKHFLFQKNTGEWIFGATVNSIMPAGLLRITNISETSVVLRWVHNRDIAYRFASLSYTDFLQENGTAYASLAAFISATKDFFAGTMAVSDANTKAEVALAKAAVDLLRGKMFPAGIHLLTGTDAAPAGTYAGFIPLADTTAISAITLTDATKVTGANTFAGVTLVQGMYYEIPGGFSTLTLSAGDMILVKS